MSLGVCLWMWRARFLVRVVEVSRVRLGGGMGGGGFVFAVRSMISSSSFSSSCMIMRRLFFRGGRGVCGVFVLFGLFVGVRGGHG
jgi:hypothetical protein